MLKIQMPNAKCTNFWSEIFSCKLPWAYGYGAIEILIIIIIIVIISIF